MSATARRLTADERVVDISAVHDVQCPEMVAEPPPLHRCVRRARWAIRGIGVGGKALPLCTQHADMFIRTGLPPRRGPGTPS